MNYRILTLACFSVFPIYSQLTSIIPKEAEITAEDQEIVARLEPHRGALTLKTDIREIVGVNLGLYSSSYDLTQALSDLNADVREKDIILNLSSDILFDFDKYNIKTSAIPTLKKVASIIQHTENKQVQIVGHTDSKGSEIYNQTLSEQRAKTIYNWLLQKVKANYQVLGRGEKKPIADNMHADGRDNPEGRAKNRRVEIIIQAK